MNSDKAFHDMYRSMCSGAKDSITAADQQTNSSLPNMFGVGNLHTTLGDLRIPMQHNPYEKKQPAAVPSSHGLSSTPSNVLAMNPNSLVGGGTNAKAKGKVGRRGDPRMHRAVKARLTNPSMTLLDALLEGGFSFPNLDIPGLSDRVIKDHDDVSLCQRKNQLMRRLRTTSGGPSPPGAESKAPTVGSHEAPTTSKGTKKSGKRMQKDEAASKKKRTTSTSGQSENDDDPNTTSEESHNKSAGLPNSSSMQHSMDTSSMLLASLTRQAQSWPNQLSQGTGAPNVPTYLQAPQANWVFSAAPPSVQGGTQPQQGNPNINPMAMNFMAVMQQQQQLQQLQQQQQTADSVHSSAAAGQPAQIAHQPTTTTTTVGHPPVEAPSNNHASAAAAPATFSANPTSHNHTAPTTHAVPTAEELTGTFLSQYQPTGYGNGNPNTSANANAAAAAAAASSEQLQNVMALVNSAAASSGAEQQHGAADQQDHHADNNKLQSPHAQQIATWNNYVNFLHQSGGGGNNNANI